MSCTTRRDWRFPDTALKPSRHSAAGQLSLKGVSFGYNPLDPRSSRISRSM